MPQLSRRVLATDREVRNAKPRGARAEYRIKGARNLVLRVSPNGARSWVFLYASPTSGKRCKLALGTYPADSLAAAKDAALRLTVAVRDGRDPLHERRIERASDTFETLANRYMSEHERKNARSGRRSASTGEAWRMLKADILPDLGHHRAGSITRRHVMDAVEAVADRGAFVAADRVLGLVRAIYNWANATGRLEVNPTLGLKKRNAARARERVLSDDEIRRLWRALDVPGKLSAEIRDALRLQLLLGLRVSEALGAARSEIDLDRRVWTIPAARTKANREHRLPLSPWAASIVMEAADRAGASPWLFPSPWADGPVRARSAVRAMLRMREDIGLGDVGTHDLRRTLATGLGNMGFADEVVERVLNHAPRTVAGRHYNHARHFDAMKRALEAWSDHVCQVVEDRSPAPNVVPLTARSEVA